MTPGLPGRFFWCAVSVMLGVSACTDRSRPLPTFTSSSSTSGSALKVPAPVLVSPADLAVFTPNSPLVLRITNVRTTYASFTPRYEVELWNPAGTFTHAMTFASQSGATSEVRVPTLVDSDVPLLWRARATYGGHVGPWSTQRTLRVSRTARITGTGSTMERGEDARLSVRLVQQGLDADCAVPADWRSTDPAIVSIASDGVATPHRLGVTTISARCEATAASRVFAVIETWRAALRFKSCELVVGDGRACLNGSMTAGTTDDVRLELTQQGSVMIGELALPAVGRIPFTGTLDLSGRLSGKGHRSTCGESGTRSVSLEILNDRVDLRIREANAPGCAPNGPFQREWQVFADLDRLSR